MAPIIPLSYAAQMIEQANKVYLCCSLAAAVTHTNSITLTQRQTASDASATASAALNNFAVAASTTVGLNEPITLSPWAKPSHHHGLPKGRLEPACPA